MKWTSLVWTIFLSSLFSCRTIPDQSALKGESQGRVTQRSCAEAANKQGYGEAFLSDGKLYRKIDEDWANTSTSNWCLEIPAFELFEHRGQKIFLTGTNLGNVQFIPFRNSPYTHSEAELKDMLRKAFADLKASGANSFRFWLHIDGSRSPSFAATRGTDLPRVSGLPAGLLDDLKWLVGTAYQDYGLLTNITLWSHDVLAVRREHGVASRDRVLHLMTDDSALQDYIDKALTPMVRGMQEKIPGSQHSYSDGILSWEVFNEPEGVSQALRLYWNYQYAMKYGDYSWRRSSMSYLNDRRRTEFAQDTGNSDWTPVRYKGWYFVGTLDPSFNHYMYKDAIDDYPSEWDFLKKAIVDDKTLSTVEIPPAKVLRFINKISGAIHRLDPLAKVSTGTHSVPYNTDIKMDGLNYENAPLNYYSDARLIEAGGDPKGILDFYQVHGYPEWSDSKKDQLINMFKNPKSHWQVNKPMIVGEHWNIVGAGNEMLTTAHYERLHDNAYAGVWGWGYFYVKEKADAAGNPLRWIDKHENQDYFRKILETMPSRLKYPIIH
ncbi:MAG: hypothetical protein NTX25_01710 [Proteobacteria bacterium]|nr:hypothetical protein [Pseudomonadota bacterium]